jgi:hypothetical protein
MFMKGGEKNQNRKGGGKNGSRGSKGSKGSPNYDLSAECSWCGRAPHPPGRKCWQDPDNTDVPPHVKKLEGAELAKLKADNRAWRKSQVAKRA